MRKRSYRAEKVKDVSWEKFQEAVEGAERVVLGVDVGKEEMVASLETSSGVVGRFRWRHPQETREVLERVSGLGEVEVAMEPSGTYGDAVRHGFEQQGLMVYRVSPKRVHDAAEVFDGTPSLHDSKSCGLIAKLHWEGCSERWMERSESERDSRATVRLLGVYERQEQRLLNQLEAQLARHWPEGLVLMDLSSVSWIELLAEMGSASAVAKNPARAEEVLRQSSRGKLGAAKREELIASARSTVGVPMRPAERRMLQSLAREVQRMRAEARCVCRELQERPGNESVRRLEPVVGWKTAQVLIALLGDPRRYAHARSYRKAMGLGLKEYSSGKHQGELHITKRGPGLVRWYLYLAVLRLTQTDPVVQAWYRAKVARQAGQHRSKAVVAVMRKLALALWHVAQGSPFDSHRLFDTRRLGDVVP